MDALDCWEDHCDDTARPEPVAQTPEQAAIQAGILAQAKDLFCDPAEAPKSKADIDRFCRQLMQEHVLPMKDSENWQYLLKTLAGHLDKLNPPISKKTTKPWLKIDRDS
jgi:hypothetical protein